MHIYNVIEKYKKASVTFKATVWFTMCNALQKLSAFLIIPILTRLLTTSDYGFYSVYLSWVDIIEILATMRIYSNGYVAGLIKNDNDQDRYTFSVQLVSIVVILVNFLIFLCFSNHISTWIQIEKKLIYYMFFSFISTSSIGIWSSRQRVNNKYKLMVIVTLLYSVLAPFASIVIAYKSGNRVEAVIIARVITQFLISLPFLIINISGIKKGIVVKYCKETLTYNFPLIPYYLSMVVLNSSDRIMIKNIVGEAEAGIYSVAYSLSMAMFVFVGALNLSLQPWFFNKLKKSSPNGAAKTISLSACIVAILNMGVLIISPELIKFVASEKYAAAIWTMPPIIYSLLIMFIYQQFLNINFYYGKNGIIFVASVTSAIINIILNSILINIYGYIAAGYTTLVSYLVIAIMYYISVRIVSNKENVDYKDYFNIPSILTIILCFGCLTFAIVFLYPYPYIRYGIVSIVMIVIVLFHKKILYLIKDESLISERRI